MKHNRIFNKVIPVMLAMLTIFALTFTSCSEDDDNADSGVAILEAYGPSPALRGGKLTFIGRNLDKVIAVVLPDNIRIFNIEVETNDRISIIIPDRAVPGKIRLLTSKGELNPKTLLTFTEPITLSSFAPSPVKPGTTLTIEGDYLNLIQQVIFADDVAVPCEDFITWERKAIKLRVPFKAQSGAIILADTAEIRLELESETRLEVTLPSITKALDLTNKKPGDLIEISVQNIDLVTAVHTPNGSSVNFTTTDNTLTFKLPNDISDGAIVMLPASEVPIAIANIGVAIPVVSGVVPAENIKAEEEITVKGVNMELVTTVAFPGVSDAVTPTTKSATEIKVKMPAAAISGDLVLNTASGKTASVAISTLKPKVLAFNPNSVNAGSLLEITGRNLDLVVSVTFGGGVKVDVTSPASDKFTVTVPVTAETGDVTVAMKNGETETFSGLPLTVVPPVFCYIPELPGTDVEIRAGNVFPFDIKNGDKLTGVQVKGTDTKYIWDGDRLYAFIPNNAGGKTTLTLISSNGKVSYDINVIGNSTIETTIYTGPIELSGWGNNFSIDKTAFEGVATGSIMKIYYASTGGGDAQIKLNDDNWSAIELTGDPNFNATYGILGLPGDATNYEITLTADILTRILTYVASWNNPAGLIIAGQNVIIAKITLITKGGGAASEVLWTGSKPTGNWSDNVTLDASKFDTAKVGNTIIVTCSDVADGAQWGTRTDGWADIVPYQDITGTSYQFTIDADVLSILQAGGIRFAGHDYTITKIELK